MRQLLKEGLLSGEIHWWFSLVGEPLPGVATEGEQEVLSAEEREQRASFLHEEDRKLYAEAHLLLRFAISQYCEEDPARLRFKNGDFGRPEIDCSTSGPRLRFSLSHTKNLATCAIVLEDDIGVDAERNVGRLFPEVNEMFALPEQVDLAARPMQAQRAGFFEYWTLKESYLKARGLGIQVPLDSFWFSKTNDRWSLRCPPNVDDSPNSWTFEAFAPTRTHLAALAIRSGHNARRKIRLLGFNRKTGPCSFAPIGDDTSTNHGTLSR
jgi:4'-phosphopantetheinyl transferase